jgi:hypothetical protein
MTTVAEITAAKRLPRRDLARFRRWFINYDAPEWDRQLDSDVGAGRLDALIHEAQRDHRTRRAVFLNSTAKSGQRLTVGFRQWLRKSRVRTPLPTPTFAHPRLARRSGERRVPPTPRKDQNRSAAWRRRTAGKPAAREGCPAKRRNRDGGRIIRPTAWSPHTCAVRPAR